MMVKKETVVLIHGLYTHGLVMALLASQLRRAGYRTIAFSYPSVRHTPAENAAALERLMASLNASRVHLLAHSLGGLIVRHLFVRGSQLPPGRVVTLGTPHQGCQIARALRARKLGFILGESIERGLLDGVPPWSGERELGSLAGTLNVGLGRLVARLPDPADGTVTVEETRLPGMADHICLPVSHTTMVFSPAVAAQASAFFATGRFRHVT